MGHRLLWSLVLGLFLFSLFGCGSESPMTKTQEETVPKGRIPMQKHK
jgi:hypothetical protein